MSNTSETPIPTTIMSVDGSILGLQVLYNAVHHRAIRMDLKDEKDAKEFAILSKWSALISQSIKDAQFELSVNPLPFPEK